VYLPRLRSFGASKLLRSEISLRSVRSTIVLAAKVSILAALRLLGYAWSFESDNGVPKGLLVATEPPTPAVILRDDAAANKTLAQLPKLAVVAQDRL
jgi:hypothetical protein